MIPPPPLGFSFWKAAVRLLDIVNKTKAPMNNEVFIIIHLLFLFYYYDLVYVSVNKRAHFSVNSIEGHFFAGI